MNAPVRHPLVDRLDADERGVLVRYAQAMPLVAGWNNEGPKFEPSLTAEAVFSQLKTRLQVRLEEQGHVVVRFGASLDAQREEVAASAVMLVLTLVGEPIRVFTRPPRLWRELDVDETRPRDRSRGVGSQPLHVDFVNAEAPPTFSALYCERPDPAGGGQSVVADMVGVEGQLTVSECDVLRRRLFRDGQVVDLENIGPDINPFAVLNDGAEQRYRYTGRLIEAVPDGEARQALGVLDELIKRRIEILPLSRGDLLVLDQRRCLHGRMKLGPQAAVAPCARRLMRLAFLRGKPCLT